jgi:hypothetical protein
VTVFWGFLLAALIVLVVIWALNKLANYFSGASDATDDKFRWKKLALAVAGLLVGLAIAYVATGFTKVATDIYGP